MIKNIKNILVFFIASVIYFVVLNSAAAYSTSTNIDQHIRMADVIVEGIILGKDQSSLKAFPGHIGHQQTPVIFNLRKEEKYVFKVNRVFKGVVTESADLAIFDIGRSESNSTRLVKGKTYILFLQKDKLSSGYVVADEGHAEYRVFDIDGVQKIKSWEQVPRLREAADYTDYESFVETLNERISEIGSR